ncbi:diphosphomevalonate/mevalonate 3,5-bisphosphate decarboxylase family protein [Seonamhaeicola aphaedonensis]|uniref:Diphosphomevalonate decarboxylase n=1 Tax=Seonamhaeicola aphaedonensis TaxID=1461338 RepID=A0A3D9H8E4_9FLAO|nr:diphosphomevalonate decarboxylase [Seonamhaeicola aphaedonensis]RED45747.1 diphosphomevalonate decarboxylase [Seonamhaeicola aphaedonensis]
MTEQDFIPKIYPKQVENGSVTWKSPSNIALVKYWGKKENQIPANPSISFTLDGCNTTTTVNFSQKESHQEYAFDVFLGGDLKESFKPKIETFFKRINTYLPFLKEYYFKIDTVNTFPHSSGIASSASGMSALALCLMSIEKMLNPDITEEYFNKKSSFLARLGSGSACRSIDGDLVVWGLHNEIEGSSDIFGIKYPFNVHENFKNYQDTILLVDKGEKPVSSTIGHGLMHNHPFAEQRFEQAHNNLSALIDVFKTGDLNGFVNIVESEALTLHAMMMCSMPYFILMKPNTLEIINKIWSYRKETGSKVCFTLDAGANVHVLYPKAEIEQVVQFIKNELVAHCENGQYICDQIGFGAKKIV